MAYCIVATVFLSWSTLLCCVIADKMPTVSPEDIDSPADQTEFQELLSRIRSDAWRTKFDPCPLETVDRLTQIDILMISLSGIVCVWLVLFLWWWHYRSNVLLLQSTVISTADLAYAGDPTPAQTPRFGRLNKKFKIIAYDLVLPADKRKTFRSRLYKDIEILKRLNKSTDLLADFVGIDTRHQAYTTQVYSFQESMLLTQMLKRGIVNAPELKCSLVLDLANGLKFIHDSPLKCHGDLRTDRCIIDSRFRLRLVVTQLPIHRYIPSGSHAKVPALKSRDDHVKSKSRTDEDSQSISMSNDNIGIIWMAPELIRDMCKDATSSSDMYSFAVIVHEISFQKGPFAYLEKENGKMNPQATLVAGSMMGTMATTAFDFKIDEASLIRLVDQRKSLPSSPPTIPDQNIKHPDALVEFMQNCFNNDPTQRWTAVQALECLERRTRGAYRDAMFNLAKRMEAASREAIQAIQKADHTPVEHVLRIVRFLGHLLPPEMCYSVLIGAEPVKRINTEPKATIMFVNLSNFNEISFGKSPLESMKLLEVLNKAYDNLLHLYDVSPMHIVGPSIMLCSGVSPENSMHASEICQMALQVVAYLKKEGPKGAQFKISINSGKVGAGMVGKIVPQFAVFGNTVNTASRMASTSSHLQIHISNDTRRALDDVSPTKFVFDFLGDKDIKGLGQMRTYALKGFEEFSDCTKCELPLQKRLDGKPPFRRTSGMSRGEGELESRMSKASDTTRSKSEYSKTNQS